MRRMREMENEFITKFTKPILPDFYGKYQSYESFETMIKILDLHYCNIPCRSHWYGPAIDHCFEDLERRLFVSNGEYGSQVNFCPMCGYKSNNMIKDAGDGK